MVAGVLHYRERRWPTGSASASAMPHLRSQVKDPELRRKLTPDYSFGCKRPTFSNDYYPTFTKEHVHLETTPIDHIEADGIVTADGQKTDIDVLVLATGFNLWDANFPAIEIIGRDGRDLGKWWRENRFQAYEGITVPGVPELRLAQQPVLLQRPVLLHDHRGADEAHGAAARGDAAPRRHTFEVTEQANTEFLDRMTDKVGNSIFALGECGTANSYYFNQHGEATLLRPTSTINSFREAGKFPLEDYAYA